MRRTLWLLAALAVSVPCSAQERGLLGLGIMVGAPTGGSAKFWTKETQAIDAAIGYNGDLVLHGDYLWHGWDILPAPQEGKVAGYAGLGLRMRNRQDDDLEFGFRTPAGVSYWMDRYPIEMFVELAPVFKVNARNALDLDGAIGLRLYFDRRGRRR
jgi:hypothetical protein